VRIINSIVNNDVKLQYDKSKSPAENLSLLGLSSNVNNLGVTCNLKTSKNAFIGYSEICKIENLAENDRNPKRKILSDFEINYAKENIRIYGNNYSAMQNDIISNYQQFTREKIEKLCIKYLKLKESVN
jgi:hypothetical protein